jgi:predicted membrane protein
MRSQQLVLGLGLIAVGVLLLLDRADVLDAGRVIGRGWPLVIIAVGALQLVEQRRASAGPLIIIAFGTLLLATRIDLLPDDVWQFIWPIGLIGVGLLFITRRSGAVRGASSDDVIRASALFSGNEVLSTSQQFRGGSATATFGGVNLDLSQARLDPAGATITVSVMFGGVEVIVPRGWRVETSGVPLFGGMENKANAPAEAGTPTLKIDATVLFGGLEVKHAR